MKAMLEIRGLEKTFVRPDGTKVEAVKEINLDIYEGEIFSLLGPNGAGKTTTISMVSGLIEPTGGDASIGGHSITRAPLAAKRMLGVIPQEIALYPTLSARQNLEFFGKMYGLGGAELGKRADEVLEFLGLSDRQKDRIDTFSGGMKRRVNIGIGLLHRPELVYMDEPTVGIDPQSRRRILDTVKQLRDEYGMTVLYTTHLMEEAEELSDRVGIIDHGRIIALGTQGELTQQVGEEDRLIFLVGYQDIPDPILERMKSEVEGVSEIVIEPIHNGDGNNLVIVAKRGRQALPDLIALATDASLDVQSVEVREPDLEAVFLKLTGRALRD